MRKARRKGTKSEQEKEPSPSSSNSATRNTSQLVHSSTRPLRHCARVQPDFLPLFPSPLLSTVANETYQQVLVVSAILVVEKFPVPLLSAIKNTDVVAIVRLLLLLD